MQKINEKNEEIINEFSKSKKEAENMINDKENSQEKLDQVYKKAQKIKKGPIKRILDDINLMIELVKDWINKEYNNIPYGSVIAIFGGLIYLVSPIDFIPDFILGVGFIDDAFVLAMVLKQVKADLEKYKKWKENKME